MKMKKLIIICAVCLCGFSSMAPADVNSGDKKFASLLPSLSDEGAGVSQWIDSIYNTLQLDSLGLQKNVFFYACKGYEYLLSQHKLQNTSLLTICDYTQSSTHKRLYVIDMEKGEVLYNTYVSHGKNSGSEFAKSFSNKADSHKSSLGFMVTGNTYVGRAGYSMYFDGMERGINNNVKARSIVMHGSDYVNEQRADEGNAMGRSYGCPAVPFEEHRKIIDAIKGGSCFFAYADDKWYASTSTILSAKFAWPVTVMPQLSGKESITGDSNQQANQPVTARL
jgi:hypothetical protein